MHTTRPFAIAISNPPTVPPTPTQGLLKRLSRTALFLLTLGGTPLAYAALGAAVTLTGGYPGTIDPGETTSLQITLSNSNTGAAVTAVAFANGLPGTLPNGLKIAGAATYNCTDPAGPTTSPGTGVLTATVGTQSISLSGGSIPARSNANSTDGTCVIDIPVTAGTSDGSSATYNYTILGGAVTGNDGAAVANSGDVNQSINVRALSRPVITKSFGSSTVYLGGASTALTITVSNPNNVALPNFSISDSFPLAGAAAAIKVAATPAATSTCTGAGVAATFNPTAGDTALSATGGTVAANGSCTMTVAVVGNQTNGAYDTGLLTNTIDRTSQFSNDLGIVPATNATAQIRARSPLAIGKSFAHSFLSTGQSDTFTITLTNNGDGDLTVTTLDDEPIDGNAGTTFGLVASGGSTTCAGGAVSTLNGGDGIRLTGGTIPHNGSCTVTVNFTGTVQNAGQPISYTNSIAAGAVGLAQAGIVSQSASAAILVADDLRVLKTGSPGSVAPGNPVRYTVTVENYGTSDINNIVVTDTFTNGQSYLTGTVNGLTYTPSLSGTGCVGLTTSSPLGDTAPAFTIGTLPHRIDINTPGSCTITFYAMSGTGAANGSSTANQIPPGGVCYNAGATCNGSASQTTGGTVSTTVLSLAKAFNLSSPQPEGTITRMTITLTNQSANALTNVAIADTLPTAGGGGQMRVATPANASSTCGSPTITAVEGSTSVAMSGGTIPGRASNGTGTAGTCFLQVDVIAGAGTYANTATATATETYANGGTHAVGPASGNANFTFSSSLSATKSFAPAAVSSGGKSTVTVRLSNSGAVALTNVAVTDPLPAGMVLANPPHAYTTCSGSTAVTATAGANSAGLTGAVIAGNGNCDFIFDVVATGSGNWTNNIPAGNITASGGISNQSAVAATLVYNAPNNPSVSKATNPSTLTFPGQVSQLTITVNNGTQAVTNLALTDHFTADGTAGAAVNGMVIAPTPAVTTTCPGGIVSATPGGTSVALSGVSLSAGATCTATVNVSSNKVGGITNYIPIGGIVTDQGLSNTGQATTSLTTQSNIGITKQFTPNVIKPGERSRLRITFYNPTPQAVSGLGVTDNLPAGLTVPAGANPSTTCTGATVSAPAANQVQVSGGSIAAAAGSTVASCYAEIDVTAASQGDYANTIPANAIAATVNGVPSTNSQPTSDTLRAKSPLSIHKAFSSRTLDAGNPVGFTTGTDSKSPGTALTMTVRLDNPNSAALTGAAFTDVFPGGLVVATTPSASTTCAGGTLVAAASATQIRLSGATIPAGGSCTVTVNVLSNISGTYTNTIAAGGVATTEGVTNEDPTSARVEISNPPPVGKQFSPAVIPPSGTSTLTIFLGNSNSSAMTLTAAFVDTLPTAPGNIVVAAMPNASKTCPGAVTATAGSGTITYANGATVPVGGCTISVDVTGTTPGVHTNNIPAASLKTNVGNNQDPANATLTISTLGYVSGKVFRDNNLVPNGTFESGTDTPISGASIELHSGSTCGGALVGSAATTDVLGNYLFSGLAAGIYSVCEPVQPSGTSNGTTTAGGIVTVSGSGGTAGTASNPTTTSSQIVNIVLTAAGGGEVSGSTGNNFAEIVPSSIAGTVFLDQNDNGTLNAADTAIASVQLELLNGASAVVATTTTDASGNYSFGNLSPGTYSVREPTQPSGTANGKTIAGAAVNGGTAGTASTQATVPSLIAGIVLPPNSASTGNNFAEVPAGRQVTGRVFLDTNKDGLFGGGESGIAGVVLNLTGNDFNGIAVSLTTTTTADGRYVFSGLPASGAGGYTVTEPTQPAGTANGITAAGSTGGTATVIAVVPSAISGIDLSNTNTLSSDNNFAEIPAPVVSTTGSIAGRVYHDKNDNGLADSGDIGIAGVKVTLSGTTQTGSNVCAAIASCVQTTLADGSFIFDKLPPSSSSGYTLTETQPADYQSRTDQPGSGCSGSPCGVAGLSGNDSQIAGIVLVAGNADTNNLFGERTGSLSGFVYQDANDNGINDNGEPGIAGITLTLTGTAASGGAACDPCTVQTGEDGSYLFPDVRNAGSAGYNLVETPPAAFLDGRETAGSQGGTVSNGSFGNAAAQNTIAAIPYKVGTPATDYNFGERLSTIVSGRVYRDGNGNAAYDAGEAIAGVTLALTGIDDKGNAVNLTTTTAADGTYSFANLRPSPTGYTVTETQPTGYQEFPGTTGTHPGTVNGNPVGTAQLNVITRIVIPSNGVGIDYDFRERTPLGRIVGYVYVDANDNGAKDASEIGLPGIPVVLTGSTTEGKDIATTLGCAATPANCRVLTDAAGAFAFENVPPGSYTLAESQNEVDLIRGSNGAYLYSDGKETAGNGGGSVNNAYYGGQAAYNTIAGLQVTPELIVAGNGSVGTYLFGERPRTNVPGLVPPIVSGYVYFDNEHNRTRETAVADPRVAGWPVTLTAVRVDGSTELICKVVTDEKGHYEFNNLTCAQEFPQWQNGLPMTGAVYASFTIEFQSNGAGSIATVPQSGGDAGRVDQGVGRIAGIVLLPGDDVVEQNLPLDPSGVVYDAVTRQPVPGAVVQIFNGGSLLPAACLVSGQNSVTTDSFGYYQFLINGGAGCPGSGTYVLQVTAPAGYQPGVSALIPPQPGSFTPSVGGVNPVQAQSTAPTGSLPTTYYLSFDLTITGNPATSSSDVVNNHIPLDPFGTGTIVMTKTTPLVNVNRGDLVPYTVTATNTQATPMNALRVVDRIPPGFRYRSGSASLDGIPSEPQVSGRDLTWPNQNFAGAEKKTWKMVLVVGTGVGEGEYTNQVWSANSQATIVSNIAGATVRVIPDPTFDCSEIIGKVFDDKNANGYQDQDEPGIANVRVVTARGLLVTTDAEGRFHVACAAIPQQDHGSNFVMKLDERTLPSGYRLTTENPRDVRVTRGKMVKLNFGATVHRVVRLELTAAAFGAGTTLAPRWQAELEALPAKLKGRPSILRIAYRGAGEEGNGRTRLDAVAARIEELWKKEAEKEGGAGHPLVIETELEGAQ